MQILLAVLVHKVGVLSSPGPFRQRGSDGAPVSAADHMFQYFQWQDLWLADVRSRQPPHLIPALPVRRERQTRLTFPFLAKAMKGNAVRG